MLTTSVCTAPLWRRIPHGEHVSRLHAADKVMTALHTLLYITLGKVHLRKQRDLRGKKHDSSQKVPHVPINPSRPCSDQGWKPATWWQWNLPVQFLQQPFAVKPEPTPQLVLRLKDVWEGTLP